jgi:general secretion pathway protein J
MASPLGLGFAPTLDRSVRIGAAGAAQPRGFTLLEVLVVLVVLGLMMAGLTQGVRLGVKAVDRQSAALDERAELDAVDRTVRGLVTHIDPGGGRTPIQIDGKTDQFHFISRLPDAAALNTHRADMTLLVDDKQRLILRWFPALHETSFADPPDPTDTVLIENVDKAEFAYWAPADGPNDQAGWHDEWTAPFLPYIVRLRLTFSDGDKRHWPDILVAPLLEQPGG